MNPFKFFAQALFVLTIAFPVCAIGQHKVPIAIEQIAAGKNADGRLELFALCADKALYHRWQVPPNGDWSDWVSLGGTNLQKFAVSNSADGRFEVLVLGGDRSLWLKAQSSPNGNWNEWSSLGGTNLQQIAIGKNADGRLEIFALGGDKAVWHKWQLAVNGGWGEWATLGGTNLQQITSGNNADGRLEVLALGSDRRVWHKWQTTPNGGWGEWANLGGTDLQQVAVGNNADGRIEISTLGGDRRVWNKWQTTPNGGWGEWSNLGGTILQQVALGNNADGRLEVFALGGDKGLWHKWQLSPNGGWGEWASLGRNDLQQMSIGNYPDGKLYAFGLSSDGQAYQTWQISPNGGWTGSWATMGSPVKIVTCSQNEHWDGTKCVPNPPPTCSMTLSPPKGYVNLGESVNVNWAVLNCTNCQISLSAWVSGDGLAFDKQIFLKTNLSSSGTITFAPNAQWTKYIVSVSGLNTPCEKINKIYVPPATPDPNTCSSCPDCWFYFKLTNSMGWCQMVAYCNKEKSEDAAKQRAQSEWPGYTITKIDYQSFVNGCPF